MVPSPAKTRIITYMTIVTMIGHDRLLKSSLRSIIGNSMECLLLEPSVTRKIAVNP